MILSDGHRAIMIETMEQKSEGADLSQCSLPVLVQYAEGTSKDVSDLLDPSSLPYFGYADTVSAVQETRDDEVKVLSVLNLEKHGITPDRSVRISYC